MNDVARVEIMKQITPTIVQPKLAVKSVSVVGFDRFSFFHALLFYYRLLTSPA